jgi:hypothetical protein
MPINPIDIMRTQEASTIKHMETTRTQHAQEQISKNFQTIVEQEHNKPKETTKSDNPEFRYDAKEKGNNSYYSSGGGKKEKKKEEEEKKDSKKTLKSGGFDVLI